MRKLSQDEWVSGAFALLCEGGIDALRIEPLAKRLGVTKGSFYWHFKNRRALHLAMLDAWEQGSTSQVISDIEANAITAVGQLGSLVARIFDVNEQTDVIETSIRAWASTDTEVADATSRVDNRRIAYVTQLLVAQGLPRPLAKRRAQLLYRAMIGEFVWRSTGGPASSRRELQELCRLIIVPADVRAGGSEHR